MSEERHEGQIKEDKHKHLVIVARTEAGHAEAQAASEQGQGQQGEMNRERTEVGGGAGRRRAMQACAEEGSLAEDMAEGGGGGGGRPFERVGVGFAPGLIQVAVGLVAV